VNVIGVIRSLFRNTFHAFFLSFSAITVTIVLVFEHKVDANVISVQIAAHSALAAKRYAPKQIVTVLVTREHHRHRNAANVCLTWLEIQSEPRRFQVLSNAAADSILAQFVEFLGLEGLGRIPGPCPTYWKGNIMEVQKRHQAFPRGYLDLGRKFGSTILPAIVEDWLADTDSDATQDRRFFLEALSAARKSPTPEAAIWRFCRRFFPSYVKYTDHHFGTKLQIPESKGRRFAEGIVASINEDNLIDLLESEQRQDE